MSAYRGNRVDSYRSLNHELDELREQTNEVIGRQNDLFKIATDDERDAMIGAWWRNSYLNDRD